LRGYFGRQVSLSSEERLALALSGLALVLSGGIIGYILIEGWTFLEASYMTIITVTTVGYSETRPLSPAGRWFTTALIVLGVGFVFYSFGTILEMMIEGGIQDIFGRRRVEKEIEKMKEHYIICGHGRMGSIVADEFFKRKLPFIVVDTEATEVQGLLERGVLAIHGNAGDEDVLRQAGIDRARGLIATVTSDADNLFITITARGLDSDLLITARAESKGAEQKMFQVGANKVISPYMIGAHRLVNTILKPAVTRFIELSSLEREMDVRLEEIEVVTNSILSGKLLKDTPIRSELGIIVLAIENKEREMMFNPSPDHPIGSGDKLITIGTPEQTDKLVKMAS